MEVGFNRICPKCNVSVIKNHKGQQCISCYHAGRKKSYCKTCNKKLLHSATNYCISCFGKSMVGENSTSWKGGLPNCTSCGNKVSVYKNSNQYNTGVCQKCYKGEKTKRWNSELTQIDREPFRTKMPEYYEWRKQVFENDNYTCQCCGDNKGGNLCSHHLENYAENKEKRFDIKNGVTLCKDCHIGFHKRFGWKNNNKQQYDNYIQLQLT